ncbi:hypothetical protein [Streptomyces sp. NPDC088812]|uniref:hypothetical protein n=1 Tax=Streptomyces sp. NPDC088812 TaxID=3365905 RepID=UPI0038129011
MNAPLPPSAVAPAGGADLLLWVAVPSAPVGYLARPYLVYRRRVRPPGAGRTRPAPGSRGAA